MAKGWFQLSSRKKDNKAALDVLARHLAVIDWARDAAEHYADIRADLTRDHHHFLPAMALMSFIKRKR